jgi:uncharacterized FAD-dependent dehydrogenase
LVALQSGNHPFLDMQCKGGDCMKYDVIIVGAGPSGIFAAYELTLLKPDTKVLLIDKGHDIFHRNCPILEEKLVKCPPPTKMKEYAGCLPACSITAGWGGAGAYSDGKFNLTTEFGGWMQDYLPASKVLELIEYVDRINLEHGATLTITDPTTPAVSNIERKAASAGLKLLKARVRHLGTEENLKILTKPCRTGLKPVSRHWWMIFWWKNCPAVQARTNLSK